jgi:hypothetical protein
MFNMSPKKSEGIVALCLWQVIIHKVLYKCDEDKSDPIYPDICGRCRHSGREVSRAKCIIRFILSLYISAHGLLLHAPENEARSIPIEPHQIADTTLPRQSLTILPLQHAI